MPRKFEVIVASPATVEQVHAAFSDENYWLARFPAIGITSTLDSLVVDDEGTTTVETTQDLGHDVLPRVIANVFPGDLKLVSTETWRPTDDGRVRGEIRMKASGTPGSGHGKALLAPDGSGVQLSVDGVVLFRVPLVGGRIESYLAGEFAVQIKAIGRFTSEWIAAQRERQ